MAAQWIVDLVHGFLFLTPAFFANSVAAFVSGLGPIDRGKLFRDGKPIFGKNKTIGGFLGAMLGGAMLAITVSIYFPEVFADVTNRYPSIKIKWYIGAVMGLAAMLGDAIGSFIKRRVDLKPGGPFPIMDQIGFLITSFLILLIFIEYPFIWVVYVLPVALVIHLGANIIAFSMGWKDVWW